MIVKLCGERLTLPSYQHFSLGPALTDADYLVLCQIAVDTNAAIRLSCES